MGAAEKAAPTQTVWHARLGGDGIDHRFSTMTYRSQLNRDFSYDYLLKVLICGDSYVGKTSVLTRFVSNKFRVTHIRTLGKLLTVFSTTVYVTIVCRGGLHDEIRDRERKENPIKNLVRLYD